MKKVNILTAGVLLSLLGSTVAFADNNHWRRDHWNNGRHNNHMSEKKWEKIQDKRARQHARWVRGNEFPAQYRSNRYMVSDWNNRQLRRPPQGYAWYRADNDYVLVRRKTNLIEEIIQALD